MFGDNRRHSHAGHLWDTSHTSTGSLESNLTYFSFKKLQFIHCFCPRRRIFMPPAEKNKRAPVESGTTHRGGKIMF